MQTIATWSVLVLYQDEHTREEAVRVCDKLVRRFWASANFDIRWICFEELERQETWREAAELAVNAHLMIFSIALEAALPSPVKQWMESWVDQRATREGAAIIGVGEKLSVTNPDAAKFRFLRALAHRAGMDYLTEIPEQMGETFPEDTEAYTSRAETMTKVMGQILSQRTIPHETPRSG
jgi:hypothetical protein